jgi:UDP-N-acetylglucosamine transferase subunit ALG13
VIFVTVGHQMPFDRMVRCVDAWAGLHENVEVFAQIGHTAYRPENLPSAVALPPEEFVDRMRDADAVVAHAGMGTILTALEFGKPILVMPRRAVFRETRNDHQLHTARCLEAQGRVHVAYDPDQLRTGLDRLHDLRGSRPVPAVASAALIEMLRQFLHDGTLPPGVGAGPR